MNETAEDLEWLQALLDDTYRRAGPHLANTHTQSTRLSALDLVRRLEGMQILVVATVTSDGRPLTGPVDGFLYQPDSTSEPHRTRFAPATLPVHRRSRPPTSAARSWWSASTDTSVPWI